MNKIKELIEQLCPEGVVFKELGELGYLYGGLTGKSKIDFQDGNAKFVTYMNIFSNISVKTDIDIFVNIGENENQNKVEYGDVLFTGSSETPNECGMSSVLTEKITEPLYLNSFSFGFRLHDKELFLPVFLKYLFRDDSIRKQIGQTASGVTRFNISKKRFAKVIIPIPPIAVQQEIAHILDSFTQLQAELEAELEVRRTQYEYYRNQLLNAKEINGKWLMNGVEVEWKTLGEVCKFVRGPFGGAIKKDCFVPSGYAIYEQQHAIYGNTDIRYFISDEKFKELKRFEVLPGDLIMSCSGTMGKIAIIPVNAPKGVINQALLKLSVKNEIGSKYLKYYFEDTITQQMNDDARGGAIKNVASVDVLKKIKIPIPPIEEQNRIVEVLDKFDSLVNDISIGLPAEILARRKQYEYYRGNLLDFKSISNG